MLTLVQWHSTDFEEVVGFQGSSDGVPKSLLHGHHMLQLSMLAF